MAIYLGNDMVGTFGMADQVNGSLVQLETLNATANNIYTPSSGHAYSSVMVNVTPTLTFGTIRPDATLYQSYSNDSLAVTNDSVTIPAWTTSSTKLIDVVNLTTTLAIDFNSYDYYVVERFLTIPVYNTTNVAQGRQEYHAATYIYEVINCPGNTFKARINNTGYTANSRQFPTINMVRVIYWSSDTAIAVSASASYGTYQSANAPTATTSALTVKSPTLYIRGHTSQFTQTFFEALTDIRRQYIIEVYRAPKSNLNYDGWGFQQLFKKTLDCAHSTNGKLT